MKKWENTASDVTPKFKLVAASALVLAISACSSNASEQTAYENDAEEAPAITATTTSPLRNEIAYDGDGNTSDVDMDLSEIEGESDETFRSTTSSPLRDPIAYDRNTENMDSDAQLDKDSDNDYTPSWAQGDNASVAAGDISSNVLQGDMRIYFAFDSAVPGSGDISSASDELKAALLEAAENNTLESVRIVGHTDSFGSSDYNMALSEERARNVRDMLQRELPNVDMSLVNIEIDAMGEQDLLEYGSTPEMQAVNRRVEVFIDTDESLASR